MARAYWDRAAECLKLARDAAVADVQNRYITIAAHYRRLAEAQERNAEQKGAERRMRAALTACAAMIGEEQQDEKHRSEPSALKPLTFSRRRNERAREPAVGHARGAMRAAALAKA